MSHRPSFASSNLGRISLDPRLNSPTATSSPPSAYGSTSLSSAVLLEVLVDLDQVHYFATSTEVAAISLATARGPCNATYRALREPKQEIRGPCMYSLQGPLVVARLMAATSVPS